MHDETSTRYSIGSGCLLNFQPTDYLAFVNLKIPDLANNTRKHVLATEPPLKAVQREGSNKRSGSWALQNNTGPTEAKPPAEVRPPGEVGAERKSTKNAAFTFERVWSQFYSNVGDRATSYFLFPVLKREERCTQTPTRFY